MPPRWAVAIHNPKSKSQNRVRPVRRAFTLLEIIVVVTIIAMLAVMVAPKLWRHIGTSKQKIARAEAATIAEELQIYLVDNNMTTPPQDMDLMVLTEGTNPYLKASDLQDPWGHNFALLVPGPSGSPFDIVSYGADGEAGGIDENKDINNNIKD